MSILRMSKPCYNAILVLALLAMTGLGIAILFAPTWGTGTDCGMGVYFATKSGDMFFIVDWGGGGSENGKLIGARIVIIVVAFMNDFLAFSVYKQKRERAIVAGIVGVVAEGVLLGLMKSFLDNFGAWMGLMNVQFCPGDGSLQVGPAFYASVAHGTGFLVVVVFLHYVEREEDETELQGNNQEYLLIAEGMTHPGGVQRGHKSVQRSSSNTRRPPKGQCGISGSQPLLSWDGGKTWTRGAPPEPGYVSEMPEYPSYQHLRQQHDQGMQPAQTRQYYPHGTIGAGDEESQQSVSEMPECPSYQHLRQQHDQGMQPAQTRQYYPHGTIGAGDEESQQSSLGIQSVRHLNTLQTNASLHGFQEQDPKGPHWG
eukprot:gb/GECG01003721.1/.p1 GENE.gb/GECG01003721.1/~~gb/GECG01003721.1/.p1  ORF type:complete len:370 (+),score=33.70 gb/GECG01003721.1/:1-1110(+)